MRQCVLFRVYGRVLEHMHRLLLRGMRLYMFQKLHRFLLRWLLGLWWVLLIWLYLLYRLLLRSVRQRLRGPGEI